MNKRLKHSLIAGGLVVALSATGGTVWALERFVVPHVVVDDVAAYEAAQNPTASATESATTSAPAEVTDTTYTSDDASIEITTHTQGTGDDTVTYYVADVELGDATRLRSAFAQNQFGENITDLVSNIATDNGAVFAVNGDYYGFRDSGIVIRNGVVYRDQGAREGLVFYEDGSVAVYDETETTAAELLADGAWNTLSFGPAIVEDGAAVAGIDDVEIDTNIGNHSIQGEQPRTAIGVIGDNHLVIVVVDGRDTGYSRGVTMTELADIMVSLGATTAYNLDGGGSSEMWFNGEVVNQPSNGGERATSDILYLAG
ncbi:phosphodiester glycosidase family protein [Microbacterium sp. LjRoot45]|uniref:phosphodiester glycosidase family protein n=1 Tax=Microbacterium sp. LjRoot45 TaxID=3342329 RepID=UPI003ECCD44F